MVSGADVWVEVTWPGIATVGLRMWQRYEHEILFVRISGPTFEYLNGFKCNEDCIDCSVPGTACNDFWPRGYEGDMEVYVW